MSLDDSVHRWIATSLAVRQLQPELCQMLRELLQWLMPPMAAFARVHAPHEADGMPQDWAVRQMLQLVEAQLQAMPSNALAGSKAPAAVQAVTLFAAVWTFGAELGTAVRPALVMMTFGVVLLYFTCLHASESAARVANARKLNGSIHGHHRSRLQSVEGAQLT
jgi:hypothetical protein